MSIAALMTQTVTVTTMAEGTADAYGDTELEAGAQTTYQAWLEPRIDRVSQNREILINRDTVLSLFSLFLPPDAVITSADRVTDSDGLAYEVMGEPAPVRTPLGVHHLEVILQRVTG